MIGTSYHCDKCGKEKQYDGPYHIAKNEAKEEGWVNKKVDLTGQQFGRLTVITEAHPHVTPKGHKMRYWVCRCICGQIKEVNQGDLRKGSTISCGCYDKERKTKHGLTWHPLYASWRSMINRCYNENDPNYRHYGGREIKVCDKWKHSFEAYIAYVTDLPGAGVSRLSLDRIDNDKGYYPGNMRWADKPTQGRNRRTPEGKTSKYRGVFLDTRAKKYCASIKSNDKYEYLGLFTVETEAAKARDKKARELGWEESTMNFPRGENYGQNE